MSPDQIEHETLLFSMEQAALTLERIQAEPSFKLSWYWRFGFGIAQTALQALILKMRSEAAEDDEFYRGSFG